VPERRDGLLSGAQKRHPMIKTSVLGLGLTAVVAVLSAAPALAQTPPAPAAEPYTFVAEWQIPRPLWAAFPVDFDKNSRPVLEKLSTDGTLIAWGVYESIVHTADGYSHGLWWTASSYAAMEKARRQLLPTAAMSQSLMGATGHRDFFLRSIVYAGKSASGEGYLTVSSYLLKAGKARDWKELWDKSSKPVFDELLAKGTLLGYSVDVEDVHTDSPMWRMVVTLSPSAEADDQYGAALDAAAAKLTPQERQTRALMTEATLEPGAHRDMYARVIRHWHK
jgi:hypothetical protein